MEHNEENLPAGPWLAWVLLILLTMSILAYGLVMHLTIPDPPRQWDFGTLPDTPAQSVFSTEEPKSAQDTTPQLPVTARKPSREPQSSSSK